MTAKGRLRQLQKGIKTEVDYTLAHVVREGERLKIPTPLCRKVLDMIHELESGKEKALATKLRRTCSFG